VAKSWVAPVRDENSELYFTSTSKISSSEWAALTQKRVRLLIIEVAGNPTTTTWWNKLEATGACRGIWVLYCEITCEALSGESRHFRRIVEHHRADWR
jgi:hypothetical protein